ncbi:hypothetical protein [Thalassobius sp. Cn5-15]|jgi:hypothetical protein|uniref:hypothetical protein n=1 Tax=Thalassobius sp. Cn5-15 TaxID=2917763 RepID=UPI001EF24102|nr:hypothetical protein [Thalassobius sp. Cn5-15]MCG7494581.1 hypothetical protein [Thalassobius sp. Cn5-15]
MQAKFIEKPLNLEVTECELELLKRGFRPQSMEQKWVIFYRDGFLNFHRVGYTLYKTKPEASDRMYIFRTLFCRRGIEPYYIPRDDFDEGGLVTRLMQKRLSTTDDEPWFGWDSRYPQSKEFLQPDFSKFESK